MTRNILIVGLVLTAFGCKDAPVYAPVGYSDKKNNELELSIQRNKIRNAEERKFIENWIKQNPKEKFYPSPMGYWVNVDIFNRKPSDTQIFTYQYDLYDFDNTKIYEKSVYRKEAIPEQVEEIKPIQDIIKLLNINENISILVPSSLAFGTSGDGEKIPNDLPLIIKLTKIE